MSLLFETIKIVNGQLLFPEWHEQRMNLAISNLWPDYPAISLEKSILVPAEFRQGVVKCTFRFGPGIKNAGFQFYHKKTIRKLRLIHCNSIDYHLKFTDRTELDLLYQQRGSCQEVIIVKNGKITDTSISNLIFYDGKKWFTPDEPLLKGTCRSRLIAEQKIAERAILPEDLSHFTGCKLINAMRDPDDEEMIPVTSIFE